MPKNLNIQFITCPKCEGSGINNFVLNCANCGGYGLGTFFEAGFLYWGPFLGRAVIKLKHLKRTVNLLINFAALMIGLSGLLALAWWFWQVGNTEKINSYFFWQDKNWLILFFWASLLAIMFVIYRLSEEEAFKNKINRLKKINNKKIKFPSNWNELKRYQRQRKIDISQGLNEEAENIIDDAFLLAKKYKSNRVLIGHLFLSLLKK